MYLVMIYKKKSLCKYEIKQSDRNYYLRYFLNL